MRAANGTTSESLEGGKRARRAEGPAPAGGELAPPQESVYRFSVCRRAVSTSVIGRMPTIRSITTSAMVARLSVITTESVSSPDSCPTGVDTSNTLYGSDGRHETGGS